MGAQMSLTRIKLIHTIVWAFFVACIVAIPAMAAAGHHRASLIFVGAVMVEVVVLAFNGGRCPLTDVAARQTSDRSANFDIYLPLWIARYNKEVFGAIFIAGTVYSLARRWGVV